MSLITYSVLHSVNKTCIMAGRSFKRCPVIYSYITYETAIDNSEEQIMIQMLMHISFSHTWRFHHVWTTIL